MWSEEVMGKAMAAGRVGTEGERCEVKQWVFGLRSDELKLLQLRELVLGCRGTSNSRQTPQKQTGAKELVCKLGKTFCDSSKQQ